MCKTNSFRNRLYVLLSFGYVLFSFRYVLFPLFAFHYYALFVFTLFMHSSYVLFLCALFMCSFYALFLWALFMHCFNVLVSETPSDLAHAQKVLLHKKNMADNKMNDVLKKLGLSDQNLLRKRYQLILFVIYL